MAVAFALAVALLSAGQLVAVLVERVEIQPPAISSLVQSAGLFSFDVPPVVGAVALCLVALLLIVCFRSEPGPLLAGSFVTGLGFAGLQLVSFEWLSALPSYSASSTWRILAAYAGAALFGAWRAARARAHARVGAEDDAMALVAQFISTVAATGLGFFVIQHLTLSTLFSPQATLLLGAFLSALPAYFAAQAWTQQIALMRPGGRKALLRLLSVNFLGSVLGAVWIKLVAIAIGVTYATFLVAALFLFAAWLFTQGRAPLLPDAVLTA